MQRPFPLRSVLGVVQLACAHRAFPSRDHRGPQPICDIGRGTVGDERACVHPLLWRCRCPRSFRQSGAAVRYSSLWEVSCSIRLTGGRRGVAERTADEFDQEQTRLLDALDGLAPADALDRLTALAARAGARRLLETLDREGGIRPCGQGCGWERAWSADSTLWPADRERSLGERSVPLSPTEQAEQEEKARLRPG
jgi:hypothetical protein